MELVSVIMPCYNDGAYLEEALDSLRAQTWVNWELILIDDGSDQPETQKAVEKIEQFPYVHVLRTDHIGPAGARNAGIRAARGAYILPLDADDTIDPIYMEWAAGVLTEQPRVGIVYCKADFFGERTGPWDLPAYTLRGMLQDNIIFVTAMFRKKDWETVGGFNLNMQNGMEDYDFWLSLLEHDRMVVQLPAVLFHYRIKPVSRTTRFQKSTQQVKDTYHTIYQNHRMLYEKYREEYDLSMRDTMIDLIERRGVLEGEADRQSAEAARLGAEAARLNGELQRQVQLNSVPIWKRVVNKYLFHNRRSI